MQLHFYAIAEPGKPGPKWQRTFNTCWPAYRDWLQSKSDAHTPDLKTARAALKYYMPEMVPTYKRLCKLAGADKLAARFLTGFQPPGYIGGCSQAVLTGPRIQLVRNYDYHPALFEGTQLLTAWNGKKVIGTSDCLAGLLDGVNEDGLAVSLAFGGSQEVGKGFGIPFILRYVLEFCSDVPQAVEALVRIPSHMAYNVTVVDKHGNFKTVQMVPDQASVVTDAPLATNHQGWITWPDNARFNQTVLRANFLEERLSENDLTAAKLVSAFLQPPLYNFRFQEGFGTLYTAIYDPAEGTVQLHWPHNSMVQSFDNFREQYQFIDFSAAVRPQVPAPAVAMENVSNGNARPHPVESTGTALPTTDTSTADNRADRSEQPATSPLESLRQTILHQGKTSWFRWADFWSHWWK